MARQMCNTAAPALVLGLQRGVLARSHRANLQGAPSVRAHLSSGSLSFAHLMAHPSFSTKCTVATCWKEAAMLALTCAWQGSSSPLSLGCLLCLLGRVNWDTAETRTTLSLTPLNHPPNTHKRTQRGGSMTCRAHFVNKPSSYPQTFEEDKFSPLDKMQLPA